MRVLLDEDIPRAFGDVFKNLGFGVIDLREEGMRGASDDAVFSFALQQKAILFTADLSFINPTKFDLKKLEGVILNRLPEVISLTKRLQELENLLKSVDKESFLGYITVLESKRIRRRPL